MKLLVSDEGGFAARLLNIVREYVTACPDEFIALLKSEQERKQLQDTQTIPKRQRKSRKQDNKKSIERNTG